MSDALQAVPRPGAESLLSRLCHRCVEQLGVDHAAIAVAIGTGPSQPGYATSEVSAELEQYAFVVGEGPSVDAMRNHAPVIVPDLTGTSSAVRWPAWSMAAVAAGIRSVATFPIEAGAITAGTLTVYHDRSLHLDQRQLALANRFAEAAFLALLDLAAGIETPHGLLAIDAVDVALPTAFGAETHQAAGMVMVQAGLPIEAALSRLRAYAFSSGRTLPEVAVDVIARRLRFGVDGYGAE